MANLNALVDTYMVFNWKKSNNSAEKELKRLKEKLLDVPVIIKDLEFECKKHKKCKCEKHPYKLDDLDCQAELSESPYLILGEIAPEEELGVMPSITNPYPVIYLHNGGRYKKERKEYAENYPLDKMVLPIGATRIEKSPGGNAICILFERDDELQYIEIMMVNGWL